MRKKLIAAAALCLTVFMMSACGGDKPEQEPAGGDTGASLKISLEEWPVIDGATALAPYYEAMAAKLLDIPVEEARQHVLCSTTDGAYTNLINKDADMIFCSLPSEDQTAQAEAAGVKFECTPFLNGGFVFFVNKDNPVDSLTVDELHNIYSGKITNWKEVGGNDQEITAYQRSEGSGSQTGIYRFIISKDEIMPAPTEKKIGDMAGIIDAVADYDNGVGAIGYSYYYYVANMHYTDQIKLIGIEGVIPSDETIADGTYPLINQSHVIIRADEPEDSILRKIIEWITSEEGQKLGEENGYVRNAALQ
ncbi:MAG: PstS family phosphate ABC transporter substrate-binding protein [Bacillota bacterium]|nr:PstS family phosphate ABC transporter substrate-binding protein [Bacillota bacterium]